MSRSGGAPRDTNGGRPPPRWEAIDARSVVSERDGASAAPLFHFAHANGFPPGCYRQLLDAVARTRPVTASEHLALRSPAPRLPLSSWDPFVGDLLDAIDAISPGAPVIGAGHSLGAAVTLHAAVARPERFSALVLIDPVILPASLRLLYTLTPGPLRARVPLIAKTLRRRDRWPDREAVYASFRTKRLFGGVSDDALSDCVDAMVMDDERGGVTLRFPKAWEAAVFSYAPPMWPAIRRAPRIPTLAVRGGRSHIITDPVWARWRRLRPDATFLEVHGAGHLVPLEAPEAVADAIHALLG